MKFALVLVGCFYLSACLLVEDEVLNPVPVDNCLRKQNEPTCGACAELHVPTNVSPELDAFDHCYDSKGSGALTGDGTACAQGNPKGANEWKELVREVCAACSSDCCYFCATEWGVLLP